MLSPAATRRLLAASTEQDEERRRARRLTARLTDRETDVLSRLAGGLSNAQIAERLNLSEATVKGHVSRVLDKLGCDNRTQAGLLAYSAGLLTD